MAEDAVEPTEDKGSDFSEMIGNLGPGEKLAVIGALIVLAGWALFDLLIDEYGIGHLPFALAVVLAAVAYRKQQGDDSPAGLPYRTLVFVLAGLLGLIGVWEFVEEARNSIFEADGTTIVGALIYYAGSVLAGVGAFQLKN